MGQLLSMESNDLLPPELADILAQLRQDAHHMPPRQLKAVLIAEYGAGFQGRFKSFETRPLASASIGQVHRARARDGRDLALKIQYPGIKAAIDADVANLGTLMRLSGLVPRDIDLDPLLEEARRQLHEEADYGREARELARFADLIGDDPGFALPRPHADLSTPQILAMDFMPSHPVEQLAEADQDARDQALTRLFELFLRELFDWGVVQTDPNFANYRLEPDSGRLVLLDFGAARAFPPDTVAVFGALLGALARGDEAELRTALTRGGFIGAQTSEAQIATLLEMAGLLRPILVSDTDFDFGDPTLLARMRALGERLGMVEGYREVPPIDALFLQRKMAGLVLLATRMGARVPVGRLIAPRIEPPAESARPAAVA
jgi:predicted unusual protein kinase regulating ubiquinone biosynthesis (AarF/ABC1/UbiB family)